MAVTRFLLNQSFIFYLYFHLLFFSLLSLSPASSKGTKKKKGKKDKKEKKSKKHKKRKNRESSSLSLTNEASSASAAALIGSPLSSDPDWGDNSVGGGGGGGTTSELTSPQLIGEAKIDIESTDILCEDDLSPFNLVLL